MGQAEEQGFEEAQEEQVEKHVIAGGKLGEYGDYELAYADGKLIAGVQAALDVRTQAAGLLDKLEAKVDGIENKWVKMFAAGAVGAARKFLAQHEEAMQDEFSAQLEKAEDEARP